MNWSLKGLGRMELVQLAILTCTVEVNGMKQNYFIFRCEECVYPPTATVNGNLMRWQVDVAFAHYVPRLSYPGALQSY
jgi:hypothetical protein